MGAAAIAAGVGAAGAIGGAVISSSAAKGAAGTQAAAADQASQNALAQYGQTRADLAPYRDVGTAGINALMQSLGLWGVPGGDQSLLQKNGINSLTFQPTQAQLAATPGYQFILNQGQQGVASSNAATGKGISGDALKGAAQYAEGLAGTTLGQQQQIFQQNLANVLNPLTNLVNVGQTAATQTGQQGVTAVSNANNALIGGANASAAGQVGSANAISGGLSSLGSAPLNYALYNQILGGGGGSGTLTQGYY